MSNGKGRIELETTGQNPVVTITLDPDVPSLVMRRADGTIAMQLSGDALYFSTAAGNPAGLNAKGRGWMGGSGEQGRLNVFRPDGHSFLKGENDTLEIEGTLIVRDSSDREVAKLVGDNAALYLGAAGNEGDLVIYDETPTKRIHLNGQRGEVLLFGRSGETRISLSGSAGDMAIRGPDGKERISFLGLLSRILVKDAGGTDRIVLDGSAGDILLANADCAEEFDVMGNPDPGTVLVLDHGTGKLTPSERPYDTGVAGVVSGAGAHRPGIVLGRIETGSGRAPVALAGRVYCMVDAETASIEPGSLLTTSSLPGHAMAACDRDRAFGAVLGKALEPLGQGRGMIPILVALQ